MKKVLPYIIIWFILIALMLGTATLIVINPHMHKGFENFFDANVMNWEQAKEILIVDYIIALPVSIIAGLITYGLTKE